MPGIWRSLSFIPPAMLEASSTARASPIISEVIGGGVQPGQILLKASLPNPTIKCQTHNTVWDGKR